ncbi:MAG: phosphoribosylaminoimidazolesuccinocarboxamide synthase [Coriobacteriales bacterium]|jgi:phosphoribosylaminoimidazole-succinocarboxamide synthase|nr:phosphoribosylaminoimidazolesuccinocarboxamide synthase [Coriobacteriales bacterium]
MLKPSAQGKVRNIYDLGDRLLFEATDRISAFDYILPSLIPAKGQVLTQLSLFWFKLLKDVPNHLISTDPTDLPAEFAADKAALAGRFMIVKKLKMLPVECIVRGYLAGSALKEYQRSGSVCGIELVAGLENSAKLPQPIYTPSTKAEIGEHDENINYQRSVELLGADYASQVRDLTLKIYQTAADYAADKGIIIADTKFEFGLDEEGKVVLADEVLTPDSSRFWPAQQYQVGLSQPSFDKQYVRDWLDANWDRQGQPPVLPDAVITETTNKYKQVYRMLTGEELPY